MSRRAGFAARHTGLISQRAALAKASWVNPRDRRVSLIYAPFARPPRMRAPRDALTASTQPTAAHLQSDNGTVRDLQRLGDLQAACRYAHSVDPGRVACSIFPQL